MRPEWGVWAPAGLAAALALLAAAELLTGPGAAPPLAAPALQTVVASAVDPAAFTGQWSQVILARPLVRPDRRPLAAVAAAAPPVDDTLPRLAAIIITAGGRTAVFAGADGTPTAVSVGGTIGAYQLRAIAPDRVSLDGPDGAVTVHPQFAGASGPGATAGGPVDTGIDSSGNGNAGGPVNAPAAPQPGPLPSAVPDSRFQGSGQ